ncbi:MAG TPA: carboxymuconolactone decarboxylase family protein [Edaphocola sp.]|nr:carboxymuconolactone decarboxylase family protein [Edaphocola sp.]
MNETIQSLFEFLQITDYQSKNLEKLAETDSKYLRDLKLNVSTVLKSKNLEAKEARLLALAAAVTDRHAALVDAFERMALAEGATGEEIAEVHACASLMSTNNVFYRFRHYLKGNEYYNKTPAGLRMSIMMNPVTGKAFFELMSLAISALNNCEMCIRSHEHSVRQHEVPEATVFDAIRLVAVIRSLIVALG